MLAFCTSCRSRQWCQYSHVSSKCIIFLIGMQVLTKICLRLHDHHSRPIANWQHACVAHAVMLHYLLCSLMWACALCRTCWMVREQS